MARAKTPKQLAIKIRSLRKQVSKLEQQRKRAMSAAKKKTVKRRPVERRKTAKRKPARRIVVRRKTARRKTAARRKRR